MKICNMLYIVWICLLYFHTTCGEKFVNNKTYIPHNNRRENLNSTDVGNVENTEETQNITYVFPSKNNRKQEDLLGRKEQKLNTKDMFGDDLFVIYASPLIYNETNTTINSNNIVEQSNNATHFTELETETVRRSSLVKSENIKVNETIEQIKTPEHNTNTRSTKLRERLSSLSKKRFRNKNAMKTKLIKIFKKPIPVNENNSSQNIMVDSDQHNVSQIDMNNTEGKLNVLEIDMKQLSKSNVTTEIPIYNSGNTINESILELQVSETDHKNDPNSEKIMQKDSLNNLKINDSFIDGKINEGHEDFHVDMIPFTLDDVIISSTSEIKENWVRPTMAKKIDDTLKKHITNKQEVHLKKKQSLKKYKGNLSKNEEKKHSIHDNPLHYSPQTPQSIQGVKSPSLQAYLPVSEVTPPTAQNGMLIIGPIPKSLPSHYKYDPYKHQLQLPFL